MRDGNYGGKLAGIVFVERTAHSQHFCFRAPFIISAVVGLAVAKQKEADVGTNVPEITLSCPV